ncbi:MAG: selenocysteine-specific translation elongation factor [Chloroflexota bacterium]
MTLVVGTAGHIDHGKTTLLRALTGIDADRLPEERRRGMTIDVGYAHLELPDATEIDFVDVPGHDRLVGNMLVGAGEIDAALLVVAADDGPRAQTLEHLALLDALEIRLGVVAITKSDIAGPARTAEVAAGTGRLLEGTSLADSPVVAVAPPGGTGIDELRAALVDLRDRLARVVQDRSPADGSRLAIDRVFTIKGRGVVVTGTLRGRPLSSGTTLRLLPGGGSVRVREIQVHGKPVRHADPGRTALNLAGIDGGDLHRGLVVTDDPNVVASDRLLVRLATPLSDRARARAHIGTDAVDAIVGRSGRDALDLPDGTAAAIIRLAMPVAVAAGDRLVLRRTGGTARITGALVLDPMPARGISRRRQTPARVGHLADAVIAGDGPAAASARLALHGVIAPTSGVVDLSKTVSADLLAAVESTVLLEVAARAADGIPLTEARAIAARALRRGATIPRTGADTIAAAVVDGLISTGDVDRDGQLVRARGTPPRDEGPDPAVAAAMDRLEQALAVPAPPGLAEAARAAACPPDGIRALEKSGRIVVLDPDLAYAARTYQEITAAAVAMARVSPLTPAALRDATGTSRRYVMAILEDLDRRGILRRTPAGHVPGPRAA